MSSPPISFFFIPQHTPTSTFCHQTFNTNPLVHHHPQNVTPQPTLAFGFRSPHITRQRHNLSQTNTSSRRRVLLPNLPRRPIQNRASSPSPQQRKLHPRLRLQMSHQMAQAKQYLPNVQDRTIHQVRAKPRSLGTKHSRSDDSCGD